MKNNLQIVSSLLQLQSGKFADPAVVDGFQSCLRRIRSMSAVHELLYRKEHLAHVDFRDYLNLLCERLSESYGAGQRIRLTVEADPDLLDVELAIPLALFVNEIVSNSFKHAFPDGRGGSITVGYSSTAERRRLQICDDGVGVTGAAVRDVARPEARTIARRPGRRRTHAGSGTARHLHDAEIPAGGRRSQHPAHGAGLTSAPRAGVHPRRSSQPSRFSAASTHERSLRPSAISAVCFSSAACFDLASV